MTVVMAGPLPPNVGGMTSCITDLLNSRLAEDITFKSFNTAKQTRPGRSLWEALTTRLSMLRKWWSVINADEYVIAHIHTCSGLSFFLDGLYLLLARTSRVPVILHVHGGRFDQFLDQLNPIMRAYARFLFRQSSITVVLSEEWKDRIYNRTHARNIDVVPNGVPIPGKYKDKNLENELQLIFIGALNKNKGILELIEALHQTPDNIKLFVIGDEAEPGFRRKVEDRISALHLDRRVILTGVLRGKEKQNYIVRSHVFVMPSHYEGLPIALLEMMASGLAPIVSPVGGVPLVVQENEEALYIEPGNVASIRKAILLMYENDELRKKLASASYSRCVENFSIDIVAEKWRNLYNKLKAEKNI